MGDDRAPEGDAGAMDGGFGLGAEEKEVREHAGLFGEAHAEKDDVAAGDGVDALDVASEAGTSETGKVCLECVEKRVVPSGVGGAGKAERGDDEAGVEEAGGGDGTQDSGRAEGVGGIDGEPEKKEAEGGVAVVEVSLALKEEGGEAPGGGNGEDGFFASPAAALEHGEKQGKGEQGAHGGREAIAEELACALAAKAGVERGDFREGEPEGVHCVVMV